MTEAVRAGRTVESCQRPTDRPRRRRCSIVVAAPPLLGFAVRIGRGERFSLGTVHIGETLQIRNATFGTRRLGLLRSSRQRVPFWRHLHVCSAPAGRRRRPMACSLCCKFTARYLYVSSHQRDNPRHDCHFTSLSMQPRHAMDWSDGQARQVGTWLRSVPPTSLVPSCLPARRPRHDGTRFRLRTAPDASQRRGSRRLGLSFSAGRTFPRPRVGPGQQTGSYLRQAVNDSRQAGGRRWPRPARWPWRAGGGTLLYSTTHTPLLMSRAKFSPLSLSSEIMSFSGRAFAAVEPGSRMK